MGVRKNFYNLNLACSFLQATSYFLKYKVTFDIQQIKERQFNRYIIERKINLLKKEYFIKNLVYTTVLSNFFHTFSV